MIAPTVAPMKPAPSAGSIPPDSLAQEGGKEGSRNSKQGRQNKPRRLIGRTRMKNFAIAPATKPMTMVQRMLIVSSSSSGVHCPPK